MMIYCVAPRRAGDGHARTHARTHPRTHARRVCGQAYDDGDDFDYGEVDVDEFLVTGDGLTQW